MILSSQSLYHKLYDQVLCPVWCNLTDPIEFQIIENIELKEDRIIERSIYHVVGVPGKNLISQIDSKLLLYDFKF